MLVSVYNIVYNRPVNCRTQSGLKSALAGSGFGDKKLHRPKRVAFLPFAVAFLALSALAASADGAPTLAKFASKGFPDNVDLRGKLFAYVIGASRDVALAYGEKQLQSSAGPVTVRVEKRSADFIVEFLNANSAVPGAPGRGTCYIQRSLGKGNYILQARILLEDDPSCFLALYPSGSGTRGDVVMYGAVVKKGLYLSDMIYRILLLSFSDIVDATSRSFDWGQVFQFEGKGPLFVAELRASGALAAPAEPLPASGSSGAPASSAPIALGQRGPFGKVALASAPGLPASGGADAPAKGPRSARIAGSVDRSSSLESLVIDLGDSGAREISPSPDAASGFIDTGDGMAKLAYIDFPRYDARGLSITALRAALYSDLIANPDSVYALVGEGFRATIVPYFDEAGRLNYACFSGGRETSWDELTSGKRDLKVRVLRIPA
jgi:hypothetical protein